MRVDQKITESHLPGQYLDIALLPRQYLDIALAAGQYKIYCPALAFDLPTQSVTYNFNTQLRLLTYQLREKMISTDQLIFEPLVQGPTILYDIKLGIIFYYK